MLSLPLATLSTLSAVLVYIVQSSENKKVDNRANQLQPITTYSLHHSLHIFHPRYNDKTDNQLQTISLLTNIQLHHYFLNNCNNHCSLIHHHQSTKMMEGINQGMLVFDHLYYTGNVCLLDATSICLLCIVIRFMYGDYSVCCHWWQLCFFKSSKSYSSTG